jgi:vancomycin resistance protein VanW
MGMIAPKPADDRTLAEFVTPLTGRTANQRHNAELSARKLNGAKIAPGAIFSFNGRVGSWSRDAGFRRAPVSYNGTLIDAWGGGVCQTSTTLYNAGLLAGLDLVERHPHRFAPSYVPPGRDAAVAFSGVDLRLKNPYSVPLTVVAEVRGEELAVRLVGAVPNFDRPTIRTEVRDRVAPREMSVERGRETPRIRNAGKPGWEVMTYRVRSGKSEPISVDSYPVMHRVIER